MPTEAWTQSSLGIGTDFPDANAILDIQSTNRGILIPRMSEAQRDSNLSTLGAPNAGLLIYNNSNNEFNYWNGTQWIAFPGGGSTNDNDWDRNSTSGYLYPSNLTDYVGIGTNVPFFPLSIQATDKGNGIFVNAAFTNGLSSGANAISTSINGMTNQKLNGISQNVSATGSGVRSGVFNTFEGSGSGTLIGIENYYSNSGSGNKTGVRNSFDFGSGGKQYGIQNSFLLSGSGTLYGVENQFFSTSNVNHYGFWNDMVTSGGGIQFGIVNALSGSGSGMQTGVYNPISNDGIATVKGIFNKMGGTGSGNKYGIENNIEDSGSASHYGVYNNILSNGSGDRFGIQTDISNNGSGVITGIGNTISNIGDSTHYGVHTQLTGTGLGNKYGTKILIDNNAGGTHYGLYSEVLKSSSFAGYFLGNTYIGSNELNGYILPKIDGSSGEVIMTNGSGQSSWNKRIYKVIFKDIQPNTASPSTGVASTWTTRALNTTEGSASFASLSSNQITLSPGKYHFIVEAPISHTGSATSQSIIYDITNGATLTEGISKLTNGSPNGQSNTIVNSIVTLSGNTTIEIRSICSTAFFLGYASTFTSNFTFTTIEIEKID